MSFFSISLIQSDAASQFQSYYQDQQPFSQSRGNKRHKQ